MKKTVQRHSVLVRINHWLVAVSGILLIFSGFGQMPMYKRYFVTSIPGLGWSGNFEATLLMHNVVSIVFVAAVVFHILYHSLMGEFGIMVKKGDFKEGIQGLLAMAGLAGEPYHGKFQAKQRLAYLSIGIISLLLVVTGVIKSYKNSGDITLDPFFLKIMTMIHTVAAILFFLLFIIHILILLMKKHRPLIGSMITGKISKEYAEHHHPGWQTK